jgi:hypothetical protein
MTSGVNPFGDIATHAPFQLMKKNNISSIVSERNRK